MKLEKIGLPGLLALGAAGAAASALLGLAAGVAIARNPEAIRRTATRLAHDAAQGLEQATLMVEQAREQLGDLWADAREAARAAVDTTDFERAAAAAPVVEPVVARARRPASARGTGADPAASADAPAASKRAAATKRAAQTKRAAATKRPTTRRRAAAGATVEASESGGTDGTRAPARARTRRAPVPDDVPAAADVTRTVAPGASESD
jgi:hypothetical protein